MTALARLAQIASFYAIGTAIEFDDFARAERLIAMYVDDALLDLGMWS